MTEEKIDYLEVDDPISGQNFCLLSFIEPEDIIQNKEAFKTAKYLQSLAKDKDKNFKDYYEDYINFQYKYSDEIDRDYIKENGPKTNIRGLKVRGVYSSKEEAESKALKLQKKDSSFHVFVGQVGYWLPFNPIADKIEDEKFINDGLQELIEGYKQNAINKDILYEEDKRDKLKRAAEELAIAKEKERKRKEEEEEEERKRKEEEGEEDTSTSSSSTNNTVPVKNNQEILTEVLEEDQDEEEDEDEEEEERQSVNLDESLKDTLEDVDPWLKNKIDTQTLSTESNIKLEEPKV